MSTKNGPRRTPAELADDNDCSTEIVLYTLINAFKFELSDKQIIWNFAGIAYPASSWKSSKPEMYLNVSLAPA